MLEGNLLFIFSEGRYLLKACPESGVILSAVKTRKERRAQVPAPLGFMFWRGGGG